MPDDTTIGQRLQSVRKRRGLTQAELAERSGVSVSLIRQIEQGQRDDTRLETARKLAAALRVSTTALIPGPDAAAPARDDIDQWEPVRHALEGRPAAQPPEPPTLPGLTAALAAVVPLVLGSQFAAVRPVLPALLRDADALTDALADTPEADDARSLRSRVRQLTAYLLGQTWQFDAATTAIDLAMDDARDQLTALAVADWQCWLLLRQGRLTETAALAARWADQAEPPRVTRASDDDLAAWGRCLIRLSSAAIRDNRPGEAKDALRYARMAAAGIGRDIAPAYCNTAFGPTTIATVTAENAIIADRPDITLSLAARVSRDSFPVPRNWYRHRLDVAAAHASMHHPADATAVLQGIRQEAPQWLAQQRYARDILGSIIGRRRTLTPEMRDLASFARLPY
jgi:transcriptional regulator with XRE-family HTH domain